VNAGVALAKKKLLGYLIVTRSLTARAVWVVKVTVTLLLTVPITRSAAAIVNNAFCTCPPISPMEATVAE